MTTLTLNQIYLSMHLQKNRWGQEVNNFVTNQCFVFLMNNQEDATINLKTCCSISGKRDTVKVLLFVGFYNML